MQNRWSSFGIVGYVEGMTLQKHEMEMCVCAVVPPVGGIQPYQTPSLKVTTVTVQERVLKSTLSRYFVQRRRKCQNSLTRWTKLSSIKRSAVQSEACKQAVSPLQLFKGSSSCVSYWAPCSSS